MNGRTICAACIIRKPLGRRSRCANREVLLRIRAGCRPKDGISLEEVDRLEIEAREDRGHDGVVLAWYMVKSDRVPHDDVLVLYWPISGSSTKGMHSAMEG